MKNQYFGDLSDYKKYGLLRTLSIEGECSLTVCWMLTRDDQSTDGRHTTYLADVREWRNHEPLVFDLLADAVFKNSRNLEIVEKSGLIPNSNYFREEIGDAPSQREAFFARLADEARNSDIVFLDPDNGLEVKSVPYGSKGAHKYIYRSEIEKLSRNGLSILLYQHFGRKERSEFIRAIALKLIDWLNVEEVFSLRTTHTVFFLVPKAAHRSRIDRSLQAVNRQWGDKIFIEIHSKESVSTVTTKNQLDLL
ncbi:MAG: hypothetical protein WDN10_02705 [bacterium]